MHKERFHKMRKDDNGAYVSSLAKALGNIAVTKSVLMDLTFKC